MKVIKVVQPRRSNEGEPSRISMIGDSSRHVYKLPKLSVKGEPHEGDTVPTDTLADNDPTSVITAEENARVHLILNNPQRSPVSKAQARMQGEFDTKLTRQCNDRNKGVQHIEYYN